MIRIKSVHIEEFRGVRDLTLDLNCQNYGIFGPNGSGKSSIVDAIEFCLTGDITRFSAPGQGNIKVKDHAPHVDNRKSPQKAKVAVEIEIPSLSRTATVTRTIAHPDSINIVPNDVSISKILESFNGLSDIAVSRRDLAKLVVAQPGQRSIDVQTLLRLETIDKIRKSLSSYARSCQRDLDEAARNAGRAEAELRDILSIAKRDRKEVLYQANSQRSVLGLKPITKLEASTNFLENSSEETGEGKTPSISKAIAISDIDATIQAIGEIELQTFRAQITNTQRMFNDLVNDNAKIYSAKLHDFYTTGRDLTVENACPLCDEYWDADELRLHLNSKIQTAEKIVERLSLIKNSLASISRKLNNIEMQVRKVLEYAIELAQTSPKLELEQYARVLKITQAELLEFESDFSKFDQAVSVLKKARWTPDSGIITRLVDLKQLISSLPDRSGKNLAFAFLTELQVRYEKVLSADNKRRKLASRCDTAHKVYDHYCDASKSVLEHIYRNVAKDLTEFYRIINEDEEKFSGELGLEPAKLWFNVDFYGRGSFPASAYHSEGHQDCLGLCLYLALMKNTHGKNFTFTMLDDVLMYTDSAHRRAISTLLKNKFPDTQFIITTHDRAWGNNMKSEGLVSNLQSIDDWTISEGPNILHNKIVWAEIEEAITSDQIPKAATLLFQYLNQVSTSLAERLRARIEYKPDVDYSVWDILSAAIESWLDILRSGISVASVWGRSDTVSLLQGRLTEAETLSSRFEKALQDTSISKHSNRWKNSQKREIQRLAETIQLWLNHLRCQNTKCGGFPYLVPRTGTAEEVRCDCGRININLKTK